MTSPSARIRCRSSTAKCGSQSRRRLTGSTLSEPAFGRAHLPRGNGEGLLRLESAVRSVKTYPEVRPIHIRGQAFLCLPLHHIAWHMRRRRAAVLFDGVSRPQLPDASRWPVRSGPEPRPATRNAVQRVRCCSGTDAGSGKAPDPLDVDATTLGGTVGLKIQTGIQVPSGNEEGSRSVCNPSWQSGVIDSA